MSSVKSMTSRAPETHPHPQSQHLSGCERKARGSDKSVRNSLEGGDQVGDKLVAATANSSQIFYTVLYQDLSRAEFLGGHLFWVIPPLENQSVVGG